MVDGEPFQTLPAVNQAELVASRLKTYARNAYRKTKITEEVTREDTVCMRENDFYVETVRRFRDRRYELKKLTKKWQKKVGGASDAAEKRAAEDRAIVYDSLQVAHKCILNSFYGYVMRKGARWRSMEMAGIVTKTGADLIVQARKLVEQIGRPLELDTDGIWCILPKSFPDVYNFKTTDGGQLKLEYPCVMLNADVHENFTNHQYQTVTDPERGVYETRSECGIFFEVDGPYRCMVLPSSLEEGKLLKKRYAVFNFDGSLAELKGFELKRRGELELIKTFQSQVFQRFLDGTSLKECYDSVGEVANHWIDVLDTQGESLETDELFDLISENRSMSRQLEDYGSQKGTSQTTARRLGEFLGAETIKDKGLNCKFIIAEQPYGAPVTERAIPTAIWKSEPAVMKHYLRKWLKAPGLDGDDFDIRNILDWKYYIERLGKSIQKIITIPAALQKLENPVPRIRHPDWLLSKVRQLNDNLQQVNINSFFKTLPPGQNNETSIGDMEDFGVARNTSKRPMVHRAKRRGQTNQSNKMDIDIEDASAKEATEDRVTLSQDNFSDWLKQKKSRWRTGQRERKRLRNSSGFRSQGSGAMGQTNTAGRPVNSMEGYIRDAALALRQSEWHVVEMRELSSSDGNRVASSGEFILWVMIGNNTLQKLQISVPRVVYITSLAELKTLSTGDVLVRKVDKHLPHNKSAAFIYEVTMTEHVYKSNQWLKSLSQTSAVEQEDIFENLYETSHPLMLRAMSVLGCVVKASQTSSPDEKLRRNFQLHELQRVHKPGDGEYLHNRLQYKKIFLYHGVNPRTKTGIIAVFVIEELEENDISKIAEDEMEWEETKEGEQKNRVTLKASSTFWVVKPGSKRAAQKGVTRKQCETLFSQLLQTIHGLAVETETSGQTSEYSSVSPQSQCSIDGLHFVDDESKACAAASEAINGRAKGNNGPTFLLVNSGKSMRQLRGSLPSMNSFPVVTLPFPPGPAHNPSTMSLPALNWEQPAIQLVMEAYFFMLAVSFPKRIEYSRYGQIPIGNMGEDECTSLYDVSLSRQLEKSRALSWANPNSARPDLGVPVMNSTNDVDLIVAEMDELEITSEQIWGDEDDIVSPVVRKPGSYRSICVEIDVHDLAIAALTDLIESGGGPVSPAGVAMFGAADNNFQKAGGTLGAEMSTSISLPLLRVVVGYWLRDAFEANSQVADDMLHHIYRLVSSPDSLMSDPALHRTIHSMMKTTFLRLLGELQRLGCTIVLGSFHKITVATSKSTLSEAEEYIKFVISTIAKKTSENGSGGIERVALRPSRYYSQVLFFDEYNYGGIEMERRSPDDVDDDSNAIVEEGDDGEANVIVNTSVFTGWSIRNYLGSEIAQEYFRAIIARFSKDIFRKEQQLRSQKGTNSIREEIVEYKRKVISMHFATDLARAVDEIVKEGGGPESFPNLPGSRLTSTSPPLEFIKNVTTMLELDTDVQKEVQTLKRGLLAQIGVAEYSKAAKWENPCASFMLSDLFCVECHESRDVNLCELPPLEGQSVPRRHWACEDCGTLYDPEVIERRLINIATKRALRYQLQDVRCTKTNRVATRALSRQSNSSAELKLDTTKKEAQTQLELLHHLAQHHELEWLEETTESLLGTFADA
jgi:DNA polymerase epsilon subunit 1